MLQVRAMPCLLLMNKGLYKTVRFKKPNYVGDPINAVKIFNEKDEHQRALQLKTWASQAISEKFGFQETQLEYRQSTRIPAKDKLHSALENVKIRNPIVPIIFNVTASLENDVGKIKPLMLEQIVKPVRWRETISFAINNGVNTLVEIGPGNVLTNLAKRIDPSLKLISLFEADQIYEFANYIESTNQDAVS